MKQYVQNVLYATQDNQHTEAIKIVAKYVAKKHNTLNGVKKLQDYCDAVETLHDFHGHMPDHLRQSRDAIRNAIFSLLNEDETAQFNNVM